MGGWRYILHVFCKVASLQQNVVVITGIGKGFSPDDFKSLLCEIPLSSSSYRLAVRSQHFQCCSTGSNPVRNTYLGVAQFGRAGCLERSSRRFKSCLSDYRDFLGRIFRMEHPTISYIKMKWVQGNMVYVGRHVCLKNMRSQFNSVCSH